MSDKVVPLKSSDEPGRFVPTGVDAQSWLGFEQRIQDRRYAVLIETARTAILAGDVRSARIALDEARELRPAADELESLEDSLNSESSVAVPAETTFFRSRAFGAAAMLAFGITLVTAIDYVRSGRTVRVISAPMLRLPGLRVPLPPVDNIPHPATAVRSQPSATVPIGTAGLEVRLDGDVTIPASLRESTITVPEALPLPPGEIPDDFVYPYPRQTPPSSLRRAVPVAAPASDRSQPAATASSTAMAPLATLPPVADATPPRVVTNVPPPTASPAAGPATSPVTAPTGVASSFARPSATPTVTVNPRGAMPPATTQPALTPSNPATFGVPRRSTSIWPASVVSDDAKVAAVLRAYARAYGDLDAAAARAVWPSVDERALARAFSTLSAQTVSFADCRIDIHGATALAACRGYASSLGKVGSGGIRTEPRQWRFELRRVGNDWRIQDAVVGSRQ